MTSAAYPEFDRLYSVSDLHMGGREANQQIFAAQEPFSKFIDLIIEEDRGLKTVLVLNGDTVDFLAEPDPVYFDARNAAEKLNAIAGNPAFEKVFHALRKYVRRKDRYLVVTLGNHDLELTLPAVRHLFLELLCGQNDAARGRVTLAFDGSGFRCTVHGKSVLCTHGNEVDDWNFTDYRELRQFVVAANIGAPPRNPRWVPNEGTRLVIELMNRIKKDWPFVDLLKPEKQAVLPLLVALDPSVKWQVLSIGRRSVAAMDQGGFRRSMELLRADAAADVSIPTGAVGSVTSPEARKESNKMLRKEVEAIARARIEGGEDLVPWTEDGTELLGAGRMFNPVAKLIDWMSGVSKQESLRKALAGLANDDSFHLETEDKTFVAMDGRVGPGIDFLITGHTHLAKCLDRRRHAGGAPGKYLNAGAWARVARIKPEWVEDSSQFKEVFETLSKGTMKAIDRHDGLVLDRHYVAVVEKTHEGVRGGLSNVTIKTNGDASLERIDV